MFFVATFPFENQSPEEAAGNDWLIGAAAIILLLAIVIGGTVIACLVAVAAVASGAQCVVAGIVLTYALGESDHSDGRLVLYAVAVAFSAIAALTATWQSARLTLPSS